MSSVYKPPAVPPEKVTAVNHEFARLYEGGGSVRTLEGRMDRGQVSDAAGGTRAAPAFKSPSGRVLYKPSPVAKLIAAMRQKKTLEEMEEIMAPETAGLDRSCLTAPGLQNVSSRDENKENMTRNLDSEGRPSAEVNESDEQQKQTKESQKDPEQEPKESQKDLEQDPVAEAANAAGSRVREGRERPTAAGRKQKVMTWLDSHEEMLQQHDPADLIVTPPAAGPAVHVGHVRDSTEETSSQEQGHDNMDDTESDDDTVKMNETDGTVQDTAENRHHEQEGDTDSNMADNEEGVVGTVEEETPEADRQDRDGEGGQEMEQPINMAENDDMGGEEGKEMEQPTNDRLSQSIAWADNIDNMSVDTTCTSEQEKSAATHLKKATTMKPFKEHVLYNWFIKPVRKSTDIVVEGHRKQDPEHQFWHSTAIVKRVTSRTVVTGSGTVYQLRGVVDRAMVLEQGFHVKVARAFRTGFPENWKQVIEDNGNSTSEKQGRRQSTKQDHPKVRESLPSTRAADTQSPALQTVLGSLKRSSSGRVVKPRMAWWANQRVVVEKDNVRIRCSSADQLAQSPAFHSFTTGKELVVQRDDLQDSRCGTPDTVKRRPTSVASRPVKTAVTDPQPADLGDPPAGSDGQRDPPDHTPETTSDLPVTRLDPTVVTTDILLDTPGAPKSRQALGTVGSSRLLRNTRTKGPPQGVPEDILNTPKPTHTFQNCESMEEDTDWTPARGTRQSARQKPPGQSDDEKKTKTAESKQSSGEPYSNTSIEQQPSTGKQVEKGRRRGGRQKKEDSVSDVQTAGNTTRKRGRPAQKRETANTEQLENTEPKVPSRHSVSDVQTSSNTTRKRGRPAKKRETTNTEQPENTEPKVPSRCNSLHEEGENQAKEAEKRGGSRRGRGRKRAQSLAGKLNTVTPRKSLRLQDAAACEIEEKKEEPAEQQRGTKRKGRQNVKTSATSLNSNGRKEQAELTPVPPRKSPRVKDTTACKPDEKKEEPTEQRRGNRKGQQNGKSKGKKEQAEGTPSDTEPEKDSQEVVAGKAPETENKGRRRYQRKRKANNKKTEEGGARPTVQVDEDNKDKCESDQDARKCQRKKAKNKSSPENSKERQAREQSKNGTETSWTLEEEKKLYSALSSISGEDECLWQKVAEVVGSHTAQDCQDRYQHMTSTSNHTAANKDKEDASNAGKDPKKPVALTGKAGTLKRKRQLQELIKQYNEGHEDEAFEDGITPFKKQRKISKGLISIDYNADEDDDVCTDVSARQAFQTPMSRLYGHSSAATAGPTPKGFRTPGIISEERQKSNLDKYVFKQQKAKKGRGLTAVQKTLGGSQQVGKKTKLPNIDFSKLLTAQPLEDVDSDEGDDYFSDNED
ncbi:PREDICTED: uncharacterized protein LOC109476980 [Branchiostoma belcheri]|uniref:Uncharacterized protein LOC109476980 n=1 Tax=Branchiostoma belcheri TaxID=7741 RepID=A0A6P4ZA48_BRABE|nr:PREDICTED: uncharacterized protein LOC109476980 [Branchiostoma belcheri]